MKQVKYPFVCVLFFIFISSGFMSLNAAEAKIMTKNLYQKISLSSSKGKIGLFAPDKYAAGETISGKVMAEPSGKTGKKRAKNVKILDDYSVEIAGVRTGIRDGWATWTIPDAKDFTVTLLNEKGKKVDSIRMPVHDGAREMKTRDFQCPEIVQEGYAFSILGQYNGVSDDTIVMAGDQELQLLVEYPRAVIVERPPRQTGEIEISVTEGNDTKRFKSRNISVLLQAGDLQLKRGQETVVTATVTGVKDLEEPLPLIVTNHSRETVHLEGEGTVWIEPSEVKPEDGSFVFESSILAHSSGSFRITATVIDEFVFALPIESPSLEEADNGEIDDNEEKKPKDDKEHEEDKEHEGEQGEDEEGDEEHEGEQGEDEEGDEEQEGEQEGDEEGDEEQEGEQEGDEEEVDLPKKDEIDWQEIENAIESLMKWYKKYWEHFDKISPKKQKKKRKKTPEEIEEEVRKLEKEKKELIKKMEEIMEKEGEEGEKSDLEKIWDALKVIAKWIGEILRIIGI